MFFLEPGLSNVGLKTKHILKQNADFLSLKKEKQNANFSQKKRKGKAERLLAWTWAEIGV
jgi:hypothetical protein